MWRYSLRWRYPHIPCTGEPVLVSEDVCEGAPVPDNILSCFTAGGDYAVCLDFLAERLVKCWPPERKAQSRLRNLRRRDPEECPAVCRRADRPRAGIATAVLQRPVTSSIAVASRCGIFLFAYLTPFITACIGRCRAAGTVPARAGTIMMSRCSSCVVPGHSGCIPSACLSRLDLSKS